MNSIKQPNFIIFGKNSIDAFNFPTNCLVITSKGAKARGWLDRFKLKNYYIFDKVETNPSIEIIDKIISDFKNSNFSHVIGLGGGSSLDVAKFVALKLKKFTIKKLKKFKESLRIGVEEDKAKQIVDNKIIFMQKALKLTMTEFEILSTLIKYKNKPNNCPNNDSCDHFGAYFKGNP